ncbi:cytochrome b [Duganella sp. FT134W]|uniref:Cytochrome b n=1 Tax=Duganella margarita TaxID=2692170 RepID=A0A7X4KGD5_9BURK|nr:cytochrome b [Duganella margarita]MYM71992.1 cytochrome b [Duganella margarita]
MENRHSISTKADRSWKYAAPAIWLHWISALLVIGLLCIGWYMMSIEDEPGSAWYFDQHKSFGLLFFVLVIVRLIWRVTHKPVPLAHSLPGWQEKLAGLMQWLLYGGMLAMPVLGYLGASHTRQGVAFFGMQLPVWAMPDHDVAEQFFDLHASLAIALTMLIALHVLAALKHLLVDKDDIFYRIWFWNRNL